MKNVIYQNEMDIFWFRTWMPSLFELVSYKKYLKKHDSRVFVSVCRILKFKSNM
jgi:hypothetical protein